VAGEGTLDDLPLLTGLDQYSNDVGLGQRTLLASLNESESLLGSKRDRVTVDARHQALNAARPVYSPPLLADRVERDEEIAGEQGALDRNFVTPDDSTGDVCREKRLKPLIAKMFECPSFLGELALDDVPLPVDQRRASDAAALPDTSSEEITRMHESRPEWAAT